MGMKKCCPDRINEIRSDDCQYFEFICWRFDSKGDSTLGYCEKLDKTVQQYHHEDAPCEPKQTTLM